MGKRRLLAFVDSNILIEGFFIPLHPAHAVMLLAADRRVDLVTCALVVQDVEDEVMQRAVQKDEYSLVTDWNDLRSAIHLRIVADPPPSLVKDVFQKYLGVMRHQADIPVLASALEIRPDWILSDNTEHFNAAVSQRCGIRISSCVEFLTSFIHGTIAREFLI